MAKLVWTSCRMDTFHGGGDCERDSDCSVELTEHSITVRYTDHHGPVVYHGASDGLGHYELKCPARGGRATLHRFAGAQKLVGDWVEAGQEGMWRITLVGASEDDVDNGA